jgi:hypothetical protein
MAIFHHGFSRGSVHASTGHGADGGKKVAAMLIAGQRPSGSGGGGRIPSVRPYLRFSTLCRGVDGDDYGQRRSLSFLIVFLLVLLVLDLI